MPRHVIRSDIAGSGAEMRRTRLIDIDVANACAVVTFAEPPGAVQRGNPCVATQFRARGEVDLHVDRVTAAARRVATPALGRLDEQSPGGERDTGLLGGRYVGLLGWVGWTHGDGGVRAIARRDPDVTDTDLQGHQD